jgi:hypothetical protein
MVHLLPGPELSVNHLNIIVIIVFCKRGGPGFEEGGKDGPEVEADRINLVG